MTPAQIAYWKRLEAMTPEERKAYHQRIDAAEPRISRSLRRIAEGAILEGGMEYGRFVQLAVEAYREARTKAHKK